MTEKYRLFLQFVFNSNLKKILIKICAKHVNNKLQSTWHNMVDNKNNSNNQNNNNKTDTCLQRKLLKL